MLEHDLIAIERFAVDEGRARALEVLELTNRSIRLEVDCAMFWHQASATQRDHRSARVGGVVYGREERLALQR